MEAWVGVFLNGYKYLKLARSRSVAGQIDTGPVAHGSAWVGGP